MFALGTILIQKETTLDPISLIGREAGVCWGADIDDPDKNYKRGLNCLANGHGRTWEYPQVYVVMEGFSARVFRELYTHIGGGPTRLQASTRYIDYESGFRYVTPPTINENKDAKAIYDKAMADITKALQTLEDLDIPREDCGMLLPLGMESKVVLRTNLRNLIDMSHQRLCTRAYWEYRDLMWHLMHGLISYSPEWATIVNTYFVPKCEVTGFCTEAKSCGRRPKKEI